MTGTGSQFVKNWSPNQSSQEAIGLQKSIGPNCTSLSLKGYFQEKNHILMFSWQNVLHIVYNTHLHTCVHKPGTCTLYWKVNINKKNLSFNSTQISRNPYVQIFSMSFSLKNFSSEIYQHISSTLHIVREVSFLRLILYSFTSVFASELILLQPRVSKLPEHQPFLAKFPWSWCSMVLSNIVAVPSSSNSSMVTVTDGK